MKMDKIVFRNEYKEINELDQLYLINTDEERAHICQVDVTLYAENDWIRFQIIQKISHLKNDVLRTTHSCYDRLVHTQTFHAADHMDCRELIFNLSSNDLRGHAAEMTASALFYKLFVFSDAMKTYLPKVVKFYEDHRDNV